MSDQSIHLNLDTIEAPRVKEPYVFAIGDRTYQFTNPAVLDWQLAESLSTIDALAEHCMSDDDRRSFYSTPLASYKLAILFEDVQKHFELGDYAPRKRRI